MRWPTNRLYAVKCFSNIIELNLWVELCKDWESTLFFLHTKHICSLTRFNLCRCRHRCSLVLCLQTTCSFFRHSCRRLRAVKHQHRELGRRKTRRNRRFAHKYLSVRCGFSPCSCCARSDPILSVSCLLFFALSRQHVGRHSNRKLNECVRIIRNCEPAS